MTLKLRSSGRSASSHPFFEGSRSRSRGSRSPAGFSSRSPSRTHDSSQVSKALGNDDTDGARNIPSAKARQSSRSPSVKNRQSWREEADKKDMALLGRSNGEAPMSRYQPMQKSTRFLSRLVRSATAGANVSIPHTPASSTSSISVGAGNSGVFAQGMSVATTAESAISLDNVNSSVSTAPVSPLLNTLLSEKNSSAPRRTAEVLARLTAAAARTKSPGPTPPSKSRETLDKSKTPGSTPSLKSREIRERGSRTPIGSPQLAPRSSPQVVSRRTLGQSAPRSR